MPRALLATAVLLVAACPARTDPTAEQLRDWVRDLDSSSYRTRDQAPNRLGGAAADAAPVRATAAGSGSSGAAERARRLLGEMAEGKAPKAEAAARRQLRRLADSESGVAREALAILNRRRNILL